MSHPGNRRKADRRKADRRKPPVAAAESGWFSPWGDPIHGGRAVPGAESSLLDADTDTHSDSRFIAREAKRLVSTEGAALPRILRTYVAARAALSLALVVAPWLASLSGGKPPVLVILLCLAYASQAVSLWLLHGSRPDADLPDHLLPRQWLSTIGVDLLAFSALRVLEPLAPLNYTALLVLPVLMAGVLTRRLVALATAAGLSLFLILAVWPLAADGGDVLLLLSQAGLAGAGLFLIALLASELSQRLAREERSARSSLEMARQQTLLNRLVIEEMADGVLVVDRRGRVRAINPAARQLLGPAGALLAVPSPLQDEPGLQPLQRALDQAYAEGSWPTAARALALALPDGERRTLQVRARFTRRSGIGADGTPPEDICVLFLEDMRAVQGRARNDKLAAMGRMSAGIAHEIRNPLAAIAQANALLLEDALPAHQQRLSHIVADNVERLKRIVDDVLAVAPGAAAPSVVIDATEEVARVCEEWRRTALGDDAARQRLQVEPAAVPLPVRFDAEHLRRVLTNLLDNAGRHAGPEPGAIRLRLRTGPAIGAVTVSVASDGAPMPPDVERHLFEPFFSTRSRGSGLGLYICRELCDRHGASIDFSLAPPGARHRNVFNVVMRQPTAGAMPSPPVPDPAAMPPDRTERLMPAAHSLLVVDDEPDLRETYEMSLVRAGYDVDCAGSVEEAWSLLVERSYSAVITDMRLPDGNGIDLLRRLEAAGQAERTIVITAYGSAENAVEALKAGAFDYLTKPVDLRQFRTVVASALGRPAQPPAGRAAPAEPVAAGAGAHPALLRLAGESAAMQQVRSLIERVARGMAPVMVQGESGTGKELVARALHEVSPRAGQPFIAVNCGAIPEQLLEAEFFGYRKGAFTGAVEDRAGFFQAAQGGTLFLDEIGDLPLAMQSKLLRAIQERSVRQVGATAELPVNVRLVSATHKDLGAEVQEGRFRQDLYYRLNVIQVRMPPLRERSSDLPLICSVLLARIARDAGVQPPPRLAPDALEQLLRYGFPGNVRELENLLHRAVTLSGDELIGAADLGLGDEPSADSGWQGLDDVVAGPAPVPPPAGVAPLPTDLVAHLDAVERDIIVRALALHRYNRTAAGSSLGLSLRQMRYRMARLGIQVAEHGPE